MPKNKPHKGLLKRIRITKTGKVKHKHATSSHMRSHKSPSKLRTLRQGKDVSNADAKRLQKLLHRRLRGRTQPISSVKRSPSPEAKRAAREASKDD
jgi:large subunit ribosomal protein L35